MSGILLEARAAAGTWNPSHAATAPATAAGQSKLLPDAGRATRARLWSPVCRSLITYMSGILQEARVAAGAWNLHTRPQHPRQQQSKASPCRMPEALPDLRQDPRLWSSWLPIFDNSHERDPPGSLDSSRSLELFTRGHRNLPPL